MKKTYLVRERRADGSVSLVEISGEVWYALLQENKALPEECRRFFIRDVIWEDGDCDVMRIEVSAGEYHAWKAEQQRQHRNRKRGGPVLSLDAPVGGEGSAPLAALLRGSPGAEDLFFQAHSLELLRRELARWRPWGCPLLDWYLQGKRRACTPWLAELCAVSPQTARKYKREFERFLIEFFGQ